MKKSFSHGWYYHYSLHKEKAERLCIAYPGLHGYLHDVITNCPQEPFLSGPRGSKLRKQVQIPLTEIKNHEVSLFAKQGLMQGGFKTAHMNVQMWMLLNDLRTVSIETPLWMTHEESPEIHSFLETSQPLSGHIDLLRIEEGKIWIWDYKPNAVKEKHAALQTLMYAFMLSQRTGIGLDSFMCGYFDESTAYSFKPSEECLSLQDEN